MENPKITKQWLLDNCCRHFHDDIKEHFPKNRKTTTVSAFIRKARKLGHSNADIDHVVYRAVPDGWEQIIIINNSMDTEVEIRKGHNHYLKEVRKKKGD